MSIKSFSFLYFIDSVFSAGRLLVGGVSSLFLLQNGLTLESIAYIKSVQAVTLILGELPTGLFADRFGSWLSLIVACLLSSLSFALYFFSHSLLYFCTAEIIAALSLCFWSGAYEAFALEKIGTDADQKTVDVFFHTSSAICSTSIVAAGFMGAYIAKWSLHATYATASLVMFILAIVILCQKRDVRLSVNEVIRIKKNIFQIFSSGRSQIKNIVFLFCVSGYIVLQFLIQPLLHFWQPLFLSIRPNIGVEKFGFIFSLYCTGQAIASILMAKFANKYPDFKNNLILCFLLVGSFAYFLSGISVNYEVVLSYFLITQGAYVVGKNSLTSLVSVYVEPSSRASTFSIISFTSRIGMILSLSMIYKIINPQTSLGVSIIGNDAQLIYRYYGALSIIIVVLLFIFLFHNWFRR